MFGEMQSKARYDMGIYDPKGLEQFRGLPGLKLPTRIPSFSETQDSGYSLNVNYRLTVNGVTNNIVDQIAFYENREQLEEHLEQWRGLIESDYNTKFDIDVTQTIKDEWGKEKTETSHMSVSAVFDKVFIIEPRNLIKEEFNKNHPEFEQEIEEITADFAQSVYTNTQEVSDYDQFNDFDEREAPENDDIEL